MIKVTTHFNIVIFSTLCVTVCVFLRDKGEVFTVYKIGHGLEDIQFDHWFSFNRNNTRGHSLKLNVNRCRLDIRKHFFCNRIIENLRNLPESFFLLNSLDKLKDSINSLDYLRSYCRGRALMSYRPCTTYYRGKKFVTYFFIEKPCNVLPKF